MDTKVNKACSYSQRVHCVVKEMNEPKETVNVERTAMEANTGTDCEGGKLKEEKMANTEAFLEMSLSEVSKTKKERDGSPRKMNYMCKGKHETWHLSISGRQSPRWIWKEAKFADGDGLLFMLIKGHGTLDSKRLLGDCMGFPGSAAGKESACNAGDPGSISGWGSSLGEGIGYLLHYSWASLVGQMVKNPPGMQEIWVQSLGWEEPLEKGMATHSSILA